MGGVRRCCEYAIVNAILNPECNAVVNAEYQRNTERYTIGNAKFHPECDTVVNAQSDPVVYPECWRWNSQYRVDDNCY